MLGFCAPGCAVGTESPFRLAAQPPSRGIVFVKLSRVGGTTLTSILCRLALNYNLTYYRADEHPSLGKIVGYEPSLRAAAADRAARGLAPLQIWFHHAVFHAAAFAALVPSAGAGRCVALVREPAQRFLSAWSVMVAPKLEEAVRHG